MSLSCGIDIGGTKIAGGVVDESGRILARLRAESPATDPEAIVDTVACLVDDLRAEHPVEHVGVGAAGFIDAGRSTVLFAPNIAWRDQPLGRQLAERTGLPVVVENDANAAAWGEYVFGAGHGSATGDMLLVTVGTGVGGGIVADGELRRGAFGIAAEIGHLRLVHGGRLCGCGNHGCWEQYASGSALVREARADAVGGSLLARPLLDRAGGDPGRITGPLVTELAQQGDPFCVEQLTELGHWLGEGVSSLVAVLDPGMVVIGGGVSAAGELLLAPLRDRFAHTLSGRGFRPAPAILGAVLGNDAGMIGAADLARR
ncbi:ROK family glucokinase [Nocardioides sp. ChNu-153]|uniref:ROK family glucokinase n=1 Tax=unclassified Nocardioides TaxID=2615069 RepID=UPI002404E6A3|nr:MULTISPECIES: ROK family glucokinase [unclassified Nocardioides]MDF9716597.1 ROK family glucokinase [Nocardioides sp. ChNu-99]MDN7120530.1 ROK family glucokinase [Nocardioides sp. ChNu-153]